jgi:hypothetical protein
VPFAHGTGIFSGQKKPTGHLRHSVGSVAPVPLKYLPFGQGVGVALANGQK